MPRRGSRGGRLAPLRSFASGPLRAPSTAYSGLSAPPRWLRRRTCSRCRLAPAVGRPALGGRLSASSACCRIKVIGPRVPCFASFATATCRASTEWRIRHSAPSRASPSTRTSATRNLSRTSASLCGPWSAVGLRSARGHGHLASLVRRTTWPPVPEPGAGTLSSLSRARPPSRTIDRFLGPFRFRRFGPRGERASGYCPGRSAGPRSVAADRC